MSRKRLLIIDGDDDFARELALHAEQRGYDALQSSSSVEGLELAETQSPDLIVLNVELGPTNGWSVCIKLKKDDALSHIPVILTSSLSTADTFEKHRKLRTRADEYLLKPYSTDALFSMVASLLGLPDSSEPLVHIDNDADAFGFDDAEALEEDLVVVGEDGAAELVEFESEDAFGEFDDDFGTLDDELPASSDSDDAAWNAPAEEPLGADPLADDALGEEFVAFDDDLGSFADDSSPPDEGLLGEFARGEFATSEFSAGALAGVASDTSSAEEWSEDAHDPLASFEGDEELGDDSFASMDDALEGTEADFASAHDPLADVPAAPPEAHDPLGYEEAPLELADAVQSGEPTNEELIEDLGSALDDGQFDLGFDSGVVTDSSETLARLGELEAELAGLRAAEATREAELTRLREELTHRDSTLHELRSELEQKERELREAQTTHAAESSNANAEKARREAMLKTLSSRGEQLLLALRKAERELKAARTEAERANALDARVASLTSELQAAQTTAAELEPLRAEVASLQAEGASLRAERDALQDEANALRADLDEARHTAERALENAGTLQEKLAASNERTQAAESRLEAIESANALTRDELLKAVERLATA